MKVTILASGYSLKGFDFSKLTGDVFAINNMYQYCNPKYIFCWDKNALNKIIGGSPGFKIQATRPVVEYLGLEHLVHTWINKNGTGLIREPNTVINYQSTVIFAINAAINMGYKEITLLGCDNEVRNNRVHFYDKKLSQNTINRYKKAFKLFDVFYKKVAESLLHDEKIITVDSSLKYFENISMNDYLKTL